MKRVKEGEFGAAFSICVLIWNIETCQSHFNTGRNEPNWGILYTYLEMSQ
jgi:hypothetical protein